ncbi:MAG: 50S ribosomal protein L29 [Clostridiaceae bacterium]|nr:50S ribosomal protein L29 [Clostridiaceae bacterium]
MKPNDLRDKSNEDLTQELVSLKEELFKLRFQHATRRLENPLQLRIVRREIARVKTIIREREIQAEKKA